MGPRIDSNLGQSPNGTCYEEGIAHDSLAAALSFSRNANYVITSSRENHCENPSMIFHCSLFFSVVPFITPTYRANNAKKATPRHQKFSGPA